MRLAVTFVIAGFILLGLAGIAPSASADGYSEGGYPDRRFFVTRSGPGGPKADTFTAPILPGGPAFWSVSAETIAGSAIIVELFQDDGGIQVLLGSWKLREAGQSSPPVLLFGGLSYAADFTPFGRRGTSVLQEHAVISHLDACFTFAPETALVGQPVTFDASCSSNPAGPIASYHWDFGDGTTGEGILGVHMYASAGTFLVTLTVADAVGFSDTTSQFIPVATTPHLVACFTFSPTTVLPGESVTFDASCSTNPAGDIAAYLWDFGDGTLGTGVLVTHAYSDAGTYTVTLTVTDSIGFSDTTSDVITVGTIRLMASFTVERVLMTVTADGSASSAPGGQILEYRWSWGDGSTGIDVVATHTFSIPGRYDIVLTIFDGSGASASAVRQITVNTSTIDFDFYDFFNVPYPDFWDLRTAFGYSVFPVNAECFNATSIAEGLCITTNPSVPDVDTYPFTNWESAVAPGRPGFEPSLNAPYRMRVTGTNVPGHNVSEPGFLPVMDDGAPPGGRLDFEWHMQYMNKTRGDELGVLCQTNWVFGNDGYISESRIRLTLDLQASRRLFGVQASNPTEAAAWWSSQTNSDCRLHGPSEIALGSWFVAMGGTVRDIGKYDIINGFEWYYQVFATNIQASVDPTTGVTTLDILHVAYGTGLLLARMFYWGNASYAENYLDSTMARGWLGLETAWFEDLAFRGSLGTTGIDFTLTTVVQSHFEQLCAPGPNGLFDRVDDVPLWRWGPTLQDYADNFFPAHPLSELDRYPGLTYVHCTPGAPTDTYGAALPYDYVPLAWDLDAGETWRFLFPREAVVFYDPNLTPSGADPRAGTFVELQSPLALGATVPGGHGAWDAQNRIWTVLGPAPTGGPVGSPGGDGQPGTLDDDYPLKPWGAILFAPEPGGQGASLEPLSSSYSGSPEGIREANANRRRWLE